ncbi:MAG: hypothetical protein LBB75_02865 [Oscillospiraceae bacterium]|jgi:hypothetical protein|nr:hypothetical protein [Oscillospiraceae bacterium]
MGSAEHCCFLRTNTAEGCITHLPELCPQEEGWRVLLLKSGHGGAADAVMAQLQRLAEAEGRAAEVFWDAPGRERRCALRLPEQKFCVLEAGAPYALEARLPGAGEELLSLDACRDNALLRGRREDLRALTGEWERELLRAARFMRAARAMKKDMAFVAGETLDIPKIERCASRFAARRFPPPNGHVGRESHRFLTAATGQGLLLRRSGLEAVCTHAVVLEDESGVAAPLLWNLLRAYALGNGLGVVSCPCLLFPHGEPEHLLVPALGLCCVTANRRHPIDFEGAQRMQAARFFRKEALQEHRCRLRFCRRTMRELLGEAYQAQAAADGLRARMDGMYAESLLPGAAEQAAAALWKQRIA